MLKKISLILLLLLPINFAFAGDGATIITESGVLIKLKNGYSQLESALAQNASDKKQIVAVKIEGETMQLNLDHVSLICRDDCKVAEITYPRKAQDR